MDIELRKKIASELYRIANDVNGMIESREQFKNYCEDELYDDLEFIGPWNGCDAYNADTNGNDGWYQMHIFVYDDGVYYADAWLTADDVERDGENADPIVDDFSAVPYSKFPFDGGEFAKWLSDRIDDGIENGINESKSILDDKIKTGAVYEELDDGSKMFQLNIPDWALCYLVNGDASGLEDDEIRMCDDWWKRNKVEILDPTDEHDDFTAHPEFGLACSTTVCNVVCK